MLTNSVAAAASAASAAGRGGGDPREERKMTGKTVSLRRRRRRRRRARHAALLFHSREVRCVPRPPRREGRSPMLRQGPSFRPSLNGAGRCPAARPPAAAVALGFTISAKPKTVNQAPFLPAMSHDSRWRKKLANPSPGFLRTRGSAIRVSPVL